MIEENISNRRVSSLHRWNKYVIMVTLATIVFLITGSWYQTTTAKPFAENIHTPNDYIPQWIQKLAEQPCCSNWTEAKWTSFPLGPGTHAKLIELTLNDETIGYFVLTATERGEWILTEYGTGPYPLFGVETLYNVLIQRQYQLSESSGSVTDNIPFPILNKTEMENWIEANYEVKRLYKNGLEALWVLQHLSSKEQLYADAKTAEIYPNDSIEIQHWFEGKSDPIGWTLEEIPNTVHIATYESFDPYMNLHWLLSKPKEVEKFNQLHALLQQNPVTYVANLYDDFLTDPYPIVETIYIDESTALYHNIVKTNISNMENLDPHAFIGIEKYGTKYVPFTLMLRMGKFYAQDSKTNASKDISAKD